MKPHICPQVWCSWSSWVFSSPRAWRPSRQQKLPSSSLSSQLHTLFISKLPTNHTHMHTQLHDAQQSKVTEIVEQKYSPFSENEMLVIGPWWPEKLATFVRSFKSHIFTIESSVPVPKMRPSGWNWAQVKPDNIQIKNMYNNSFISMKEQ